MNPKTILLLLLCGLGVFVKAQGFSKRYVDTRPAMQYGALAITDSAFYTVGVTTNMNWPYIVKPLWSKLSFDGSLEDYHALNDTDNYWYGTFFNTYATQGDSLVKLFGYIADTVLYPILWTIGYDGAVKRAVTYPDSGSDNIRGDYMTSDTNNNYYLGASYEYTLGSINAYIIKVNAQDSVLWKKRYGALGVWNESVTSISLMNNNHVIVGSWKSDQDLPNMKSYTWLFELDDTGSIVRQWFDHDSTMEAVALKQTRDGGIVYGSKKILDQDGGDAYCHTTVVKMDSAFTKQWTFEGTMRMGSSAGVFDIEELPDSGFLVCCIGNYINPTHNLGSGWVMRLRKDGSVMWNNGYTALDTPGVNNFLNDIDVLPDGSYVAVGYINMPPSITQTQSQQAWMLKIDSNGCVLENCLTGISPFSIQNSEFSIYPNPATTSFSLDIENLLLQGGSLDLYNIDGKKLSTTANNFTRQTKVDISQLPNGIYLWRYTAPNQVVQSGKVVKE